MTLILILPAAALAAVILAYITRLLAADTVLSGRHYEATVRRRPAGWMPPTPAARLRALADTQQMEAIR